MPGEGFDHPVGRTGGRESESLGMPRLYPCDPVHSPANGLLDETPPRRPPALLWPRRVQSIVFAGRENEMIERAGRQDAFLLLLFKSLLLLLIAI
jgi:hypothetical protein